MTDWVPFEHGRSLGRTGSESGVILLDDELPAGARITLERDGVSAPFSITCGVYGCMVHTRFFGTEAEARRECDAMKLALVELVAALGEDVALDAVGELCSAFVDRFP